MFEKVNLIACVTLNRLLRSV